MLLQTIPIKFSPGAVYPVTLQGEHNTIRIAAKLPDRMSGVIFDYFICLFKCDDVIIKSPLIYPGSSGNHYFSNNTVYIMLWQQLTDCKTLQMQVVAYRSEGGEPIYIAKTPISETLVFDESFAMSSLESSEQSDLISQIFAALEAVPFEQIRLNTAARHTHSNKSGILDKLTTQEGTGRLLFDMTPTNRLGTCDPNDMPETGGPGEVLISNAPGEAVRAFAWNIDTGTWDEIGAGGGGGGASVTVIDDIADLPTGAEGDVAALKTKVYVNEGTHERVFLEETPSIVGDMLFITSLRPCVYIYFKTEIDAAIFGFPTRLLSNKWVKSITDEDDGHPISYVVYGEGDFLTLPTLDNVEITTDYGSPADEVMYTYNYSDIYIHNGANWISVKTDTAINPIVNQGGSFIIEKHVINTHSTGGSDIHYVLPLKGEFVLWIKVDSGGRVSFNNFGSVATAVVQWPDATPHTFSEGTHYVEGIYNPIDKIWALKATAFSVPSL